MSRPGPRLATRLMTAQALVIGIGAATMIAAAVLIGPALFHQHLAMTGEDSPAVVDHAEEAFTSAFALSLVFATVASLITAGVVSWFLVRRVATPVEELADAAECVAAGHYDVTVPDARFSSELQRLSQSFGYMTIRLADTESTRTRLLSDLAHELRTPLATLEAYIDGLEDEVLPTDAASWSTMRDQVARLRRLAGDLRETAAAEEHALGIVLVRTDLGLVATAAVAAAAPRYDAKGVALVHDAVDAPIWIQGDVVRLQQVFSNLLDNALRHTPPAGSVTVVVDVQDALAEVRVTDTGEGIPEHHLSSVFERFHRVDPSRASSDGSGSGLGLTIARAIVAEHGGTLGAESQGSGAGSSFVVRIPTR
jgi:two-component system, OmpR family, sensor histidine kinase BaeS